MEIEENYIIDEQTIGIFPAKNIHYDSIVIEKETIKQIRKTPFEIIDESCCYYWSSYEGKRKATIKKTGFKEKVPIPIHIQKGIVAIPTHGIRHIDCSWLMLNHILHYERNGRNKTTITFTNEKSIAINISIRSFQSQFERAVEIKYRSKLDLR